MSIGMSRVIDGTHFSDAVHRKLGCSDIDRSDPDSAREDRTDGRTTRHVVTHHKILPHK